MRGARQRRTRSPQPAGGNAGAARFFVQVGDRLVAGGDVLLQRCELRHRFLAFASESRALRRVVAVYEIGAQGVDFRLQRVGEGRIVLELRVERFQAADQYASSFAAGSAGFLSSAFLPSAGASAAFVADASAGAGGAEPASGAPRSLFV